MHMYGSINVTFSTILDPTSRLDPAPTPAIPSSLRTARRTTGLKLALSGVNAAPYLESINHMILIHFIASLPRVINHYVRCDWCVLTWNRGKQS